MKAPPMPRGAQRGSKHKRTTARAIAVDLKKAQALELRMQGWTYRTIAETLKISGTRAFQLVEDAIRETVHEPLEKHRNLAIFRAEAAMTQTFPRVAAGDQMAIANWLAIENRLDKLRGIVSPEAAMGQNLNVSGGLKHEIIVSFVTPEPQDEPLLIEAKALNGHANGKGNGHG